MREVFERSLGILVGNARRIPGISEIRIYGSYNNGGWDERVSDVDISVKMEDESSSFISSSRGENSKKVDSIRRTLKEGIIRGVAVRLSVDVMNQVDMQREFLPGEGIYADWIKNRRVIYP